MGGRSAFPVAVERDRLLLVIHCDRGQNIRIISACPATPYETRSYEQGL